MLLTGAGEEGVSLIAISQASGVTLAQDPADAYMPFMPMNALRYNHIDGGFLLRDLASVVSALAMGRAVSGTKGRVGN